MRRVCKSVSFLINPCRHRQFPSAKYQNTVYKILAKTTIFALNLLLPIPYLARRGFPPRGKKISRGDKKYPFSSLFPSVPTTLFLLSLPKKGDFPQIPRRKKEDKNAPVPPCCSILFPDLLLPSAGNRGGCTVGVCN